ncbi:cob(I)yrinic acid a,c-diamide adenosyltransferase, partial [Elusimicrobiota bacterium]
MIHVYTGNGKGKTTAAIGQTIRAVASNLKVLFFFFNKEKKESSGEYKILQQIGVET